ncbi:serine/threonine-protein kinase 24-like [Biomphalaria glabrata]|uniref:dual-specificity kinase n=1 Tax=Biomphalaria glabrata TaxID=6526 RepID=A0A9W3AAY3_BIOGL|nr:serine/threonine-protein kinase 24-like [Biomphalaria glabrata]XP_055884306.1 serine/threonine-protein kinase 24-like [Biomphalaria glabrata]XP_055884307.1 serine/threonine-protein kinase 24-like [Biomphalaria glabrata]XP_055884308.1 serine/threonine-protein kinase 24-like [Biomphalaria glabrata]XP_055884309.1 serine/threonine-protein kinase 24-like [Biomphalaria glabrata]XP_055884310.1 serine/threonine-protein kinase 24-like [Biomphalaria glabrata]XP_055884311.1 serine/threonine-protein k
MKITLKKYIRMSDNKVDTGQVAKPVLRHLRRSKTINVSHFGTNNGQSRNEGSFTDAYEGHRSPSPTPQPTSSCQALKHAVSALTRIDDFILEELGDGFFANVYKATHKVTNEEMVMKVNKDSANRSSALREVQLMNKLSHPNILRFLGVCVHEGQLHALTEYISGGTLETLLANKDEELPWTLRIKLSLDIAKGMHYLHAEGVFHRDLTSKNVLIKKGENRNYQAVIADFGLATKIPEPNTEPLPSVGCPWWMAPEVIHGKYYDQRADLFSYGIILLEITARIEADPETMPRTKKFGVDYIKICEMVDYCPLDFLQLAFKCCQILPELRPSSSVIISNLEKLYKSLRSNSQNNLGKLHKRSRSEDNIIQSSDSMAGDEILMTPQIIAQAMTKDDPHYCPANANPFASISKFKDGRKVLEFPKQRKCSFNNGLALLLGRQADQMSSSCNGSHIFMKPESQSLPCSPVMLRKAAEKLHQASLHGSDAVELEEDPKIRFTASSDHQDSGNTSPASEKRARFGCSRTRSLGSLDFFSPMGLSSTGRMRLKINPSGQLDKKGYCNRETARIRESSVEDQLLNGLGESTDDLNENSVYSDCVVHLRNSITSGSFKSVSSDREETSREGRFSSLDQDETSGAGYFGSCGESLSCCSLSSYVSCGDLEELDERSAEVFSDQVVPVGSECLGELDVSKPCIAIDSKSYEANHFSLDTVKECLGTMGEAQDLIITKF